MGGRGSSSGMNAYIDYLSREGVGKGESKPIGILPYSDWTLEDVERHIRKLGHEELFVFDKDGKLVEAYKGDKHSVAFPADLTQMEGATVTHNHPDKNFGGTFSFADMKNMLKSKWAEHRATAGTGNGEMNYILRATSKAKHDKYYRQINKDYTALTSRMRERYKEEYKRALARGSSKSVAAKNARQAQVGVLNAYYKETAPKFGFQYITRKKDYTYNR